MFKECPHPDEKQRLQLSRELGLAPRQIKFWFQNRRTQMKVSAILLCSSSSSSSAFMLIMMLLSCALVI